MKVRLQEDLPPLQDRAAKGVVRYLNPRHKQRQG
jgi:hypothetical protein